MPNWVMGRGFGLSLLFIRSGSTINERARIGFPYPRPDGPNMITYHHVRLKLNEYLRVGTIDVCRYLHRKGSNKKNNSKHRDNTYKKRAISMHITLYMYRYSPFSVHILFLLYILPKHVRYHSFVQSVYPAEVLTYISICDSMRRHMVESKGNFLLACPYLVACYSSPAVSE